MKTVFKMIMVLLAFLGIMCGTVKSDSDYNSVTSFSEGKAIRFPDFTLTFLGIKDEKKELPNGSLNFRFYEFRLTDGINEKTVRWSSGTGDIAPVGFEFGSKDYQLELSYSEKLKKKLNENELVIVKR
jgi:hypothetical protein